MKKILVLEDAEDSYLIIEKSIGHVYELQWARTIAEAKRLAQSSIFDLILIDVVLPDGDGFSFCTWLKEQEQMRDAPMIFLTSKGQIQDKLLGFSIGADDYITKPFDLFELKARIEARLRNINMLKSKNNRLKFNGIEVDLRSQKAVLVVNQKSEPIDLTPIEYRLLVLFLQQPNKVYSRDEILGFIWGDGLSVDPRSVDTHVSKLRKKLGTKSGSIKSVHGTGYKFIS